MKSCEVACAQQPAIGFCNIRDAFCDRAFVKIIARRLQRFVSPAPGGSALCAHYLAQRASEISLREYLSRFRQPASGEKNFRARGPGLEYLARSFKVAHAKL